jgi:hypothetical protein
MADRALARNAVPWGVAVRGADAIVKREMVGKWMGFNATIVPWRHAGAGWQLGRQGKRVRQEPREIPAFGFPANEVLLG